MSEWLIRPYNRDLDEDSMRYLLGRMYLTSHAARRATYGTEKSEKHARNVAFVGIMRPIWDWVLEHADIQLAVDALAPDTSIWAWLATSGPGVIHALGVKREAIGAGIGMELVRELCGPRWEDFQVLSLEMPQLRTPRDGWRSHGDWLNYDRPKKWVVDPTWLLLKMVSK